MKYQVSLYEIFKSVIHFYDFFDKDITTLERDDFKREAKNRFDINLDAEYVEFMWDCYQWWLFKRCALLEEGHKLESQLEVCRDTEMVSLKFYTRYATNVMDGSSKERAKELENA